MALLRQTSPHTHTALGTPAVMQLVLLALIPGICTQLYFFGWGVLSNIVLAGIFAVALEAAFIGLRRRPVGFYLSDFSALVTAVLLAVAMPPASPWWLILVGILFAIGVAKHLYGGLGYNPFNPAMVGYVVLLISFPIEMTRWLTPQALLPAGIETSSLADTLRLVAGVAPVQNLDALTMATPLDVLRQNKSLMMDDLWAANVQFGRFAGVGWEWVNVAYLCGGLFLLWRRIYTWHAPISMLATLALMSLVFYDGGSSASRGSPMFHLFSGATMLGAFFIVTDPVTSAVSNRGRLIYGAAIGVLLFTIRSWGNYPDAMAFAVLLMNFSAPFIDHYTQPRTFGHQARDQKREGR